MLHIYNSLTRQKAPFTPLDAKRVRMYVCGMTVYDFCHIGHARVMVVFDVVYRFLCHIYGKAQVEYVRNITDIDDKIITRIKQDHISINVLTTDEMRKDELRKFTTRFIDAMHEDSAQLGILAPNAEPRATQYITQIIDMIATLEKNGYAYRAGNGDVYYDVSRFAPYGQLSGRHLEDLRAGERVAIDEAKDDPLDFVLWKPAKPGEPSWDSPWGAGRPGWHIECSAMSTHCLGDHFDIHGGGMDLQFPHHENEIAQSCAATDAPFVNVWMHNGFVRVDNDKMSKSLGNFSTIRDVMKKLDDHDHERAGEIIRLFILGSHYRSPLNYSIDQLKSAEKRLQRLYRALYEASKIVGQVNDNNIDKRYESAFRAAMDDDFNTPIALSVLDEIVTALNRIKDTDSLAVLVLVNTLTKLSRVLGILGMEPERFLKMIVKSIPPGNLTINGNAPKVSVQTFEDRIDELINQRNAARKAKNFAESDRIRDELLGQGIVLEDGPQGTIWRRQ